MRVLGIDHVNIAGSAALIDRVRSFYVDILGLTEGHRPPFESRGFWLYAGDQAVVHLRVKEEDAAAASTALDHYAFQCEGLEAAMQRLRERGIPFELDPARDTKPAQLFLNDPTGLGLELSFV